jgi:glycosyltransferase involved in cell wall biosynthesis
VRLLIDSFCDFVRDAPDDDETQLWIIGDGKGRRGLEAQARHLGWRVRFLGVVARDQLGEFYNAADIFAFPGLREPLGMVYLEAQACGLPVVAFRNGGVPDAVVEGGTGLLVEPMDCAGFTAALTRLIRQKRLRRSLGEAAIRHVRERCEPRRWVSSFLGAAQAPTSTVLTPGTGFHSNRALSRQEPVGSRLTGS